MITTSQTLTLISFENLISIASPLNYPQVIAPHQISCTLRFERLLKIAPLPSSILDRNIPLIFCTLLTIFLVLNTLLPQPVAKVAWW